MCSASEPRQHRHGRVVGVDAFSRKHVFADHLTYIEYARFAAGKIFQRTASYADTLHDLSRRRTSYLSSFGELLAGIAALLRACAKSALFTSPSSASADGFNGVVVGIQVGRHGPPRASCDEGAAFVAKYALYLPLNRQSAAYAREGIALLFINLDL